MARFYDDSLLCTNNTDADFRAWVQFIDTTFTSGGWVNTADTGQLVIASATKPGAAFTKVGYRIYKMNDSLAGSAPCFVKMYFGSSGATLTPGCWVVVGTGSDGSGGLTGIVHDDSAVSTCTFAAGTNSTSTANRCFSHATTSSLALGMWITSVSAAYGQLWGIERTRDSVGAETGTGFFMAYSLSGSGLTRSRYMEPALGGVGSQPAVELGVAHIMTGLNPYTFGSDLPVGVIFPIKATAQPASHNYVIVKQYAQQVGAKLVMSFEGSTHTYQSLEPQAAQHNGSSILTTSIVYMRYDI